MLGTDVVKTERELVLDLLEHAGGDANTTGLRQPFEARRHIDGVTEQVIALGHDVAKVDADAKSQLALVRELRIADRQFLLD